MTDAPLFGDGFATRGCYPIESPESHGVISSIVSIADKLLSASLPVTVAIMWLEARLRLCHVSTKSEACPDQHPAGQFVPNRF
jgi:hypothetical protein